MITRLIAIVRNIRNRPITRLHVAAGGALIGVGVALIHAYATEVQERLTASYEELEELDGRLDERYRERAAVRTEIATLRDELGGLNAELVHGQAAAAAYPTREDLAPLTAGDDA